MSASRASSVITTPCTMSSGSFPDRRALMTQDTSPIEPAGPGTIRRLRKRLARIDGFERAFGISHERSFEAIVSFDPVIVEPADVAHPVAVDVRVESRRDPHEPRALRPFGFRLQPYARVA